MRPNSLLGVSADLASDLPLPSRSPFAVFPVAPAPGSMANHPMLGEDAQVLIRKSREAADSSSGVYTGEVAGEDLPFPPATNPCAGVAEPTAAPALAAALPGARTNVGGYLLTGRNVLGEGNVRAGGMPVAFEVGVNVADVGGVGS